MLRSPPLNPRDLHLPLVEVLFHGNFLSVDEKGLSPAYKHGSFLLRNTPLLSVRWRDPISSMAIAQSASDKGVRLCLHFPLGHNWANMGTLKRCSSNHRPGSDDEARRRPGCGDIMYALCLLIFLQPGRTGELWTLVPHPPFFCL